MQTCAYGWIVECYKIEIELTRPKSPHVRCRELIEMNCQHFSFMYFFIVISVFDVQCCTSLLWHNKQYNKIIWQHTNCWLAVSWLLKTILLLLTQSYGGCHHWTGEWSMSLGTEPGHRQYATKCSTIWYVLCQLIFNIKSVIYWNVKCKETAFVQVSCCSASWPFSALVPVSVFVHCVLMSRWYIFIALVVG